MIAIHRRTQQLWSCSWLLVKNKSDEININNKYNEIFYHFYSVVDAIEPDIVLLWGGGLGYGFGIIGDIAKNKGIKIYHTENGLIPPGIMIDEKGCQWNSSTAPLTIKEISNERFPESY